MRTALDAMNRMRWDTAYCETLCVVGIIDRFGGIEERTLTAVMDGKGTSDPEIAVPEHRIIYLKYDGTIWWDKRTKTDRLFGSTL